MTEGKGRVERQDWDVSDRCERGWKRKASEREREIQRVGDREEDNHAGEEMIVDIQQGQQRYAGHLLL